MRLAENAHIQPQQLVALPVRDVKRLLTAQDDQVAVQVLRELTAEPTRALEPEPEGLWKTLRRLLVAAIGWIRDVLAIVALSLVGEKIGPST